MSRSADWPDAREQILDRDNRSCQYCRSSGELDVHHITPREEFEDEARANTVHNLVTLCDSCHKTLEYYDPVVQERKLWKEGWRPTKVHEEVQELGLLIEEQSNPLGDGSDRAAIRNQVRVVMDSIEGDLDQLSSNGHDEIVREFYRRFSRERRLEREVKELREKLDENGKNDE